jgi:hypothetical protein
VKIVPRLGVPPYLPEWHPQGVKLETVLELIRNVSVLGIFFEPKGLIGMHPAARIRDKITGMKKNRNPRNIYCSPRLGSRNRVWLCRKDFGHDPVELGCILTPNGIHIPEPGSA